MGPGGTIIGGKRIPPGPNLLNMATCNVNVAASLEKTFEHPASDLMRYPGRTGEFVIIDGTGLIRSRVNWCYRILQIDAQGSDGRHWRRSYESSPGRELPIPPCSIHRVLGWLAG